MENSAMPAIGPGADLNKMAPLNQRRSVTFMNHLLAHTADFLNKFSNMASEKLSQQSHDMQRIEIALNILEAKLASIPGLDDIKQPETAAQPQEQSNEPRPTEDNVPQPQNNEESIIENTAPSADVLTVKNDIRYMKYLKMVSVGVPKAAVSNKMLAEGLDPDLLDTPDAPVPDGGMGEEESDNESQSLSSDDNFSD